MAQTHERECVVCTNDFTTPKILPCGHLLCRECVISWMDSKREADCPLCRCPIVKQSGQSSSETVDALPTDDVMEALVECARALSKDHLCCMCKGVRADFICTQCLEMLCSPCAKPNKKFSATRSHEVKSLSTVTVERLAASRPALCAEHNDEQADSFCFHHRLPVCKTCKFHKHRECSKVSDLDCEEQSAQNSLRDLTKILVEAEQKLEQAIGQLTSRLQEVNVSEQEDITEVDKTCDHLQKLVEEIRKKLKDKTRTSHFNIRKSLRDVKTDLSKRLGKVTSHKHIVTRVTAVSPRPALIHMTQTLTDRVNSLDLSAHLKRELWVKPSSSVECCQALVRRIEQMLLQLKAEKKTPVFVFHENRGTNILLTNYKMTAERMQPEEDFGNAVVVSRDAMAENVLYEVRVDGIGEFHWNTLTLGVTGTPPAQLAMTTWSEELEDSIIIQHSGVSHHGRIFKVNYGLALKNIQVGSRVGVLVGSSNDLHLYVNGEDQGVAAENVPQPCFAIFDVCNKVFQVTTLPTSRMT